MGNKICNKCETENSINSKYCSRCGFELIIAPNNPTNSKNIEHSYHFEYTESRDIAKFLLTCSGVLIISIIASLIFLSDRIGFYQSIALALVLPITIYILFNKKIKKYGSAILNMEYVEFLLENQTRKIHLKDIKSFQIEYFNGTSFYLFVSNEEPLKIVANDNFCKDSFLKNFCKKWEETVTQYCSDNINVSIQKKESALGYILTLPIMLTLTITVVGGVAYTYFLSLNSNKEISEKLYTPIGLLLILWSTYFKLKSNKNKKTTANSA